MSLLILNACEPDPVPPQDPNLVEKKVFDTEEIRWAVDDYKTNPSPERSRRVADAFGAFDDELHALEDEARTETGDERRATEERIADLKFRRGIHWARAQSTPEEMAPAPVAERVPPRAEPVRRHHRK